MAPVEFVSPMLASSSGPEVNVEDWVFERKLDGLRCVAVRNGSHVELWSRNHLSFTKRFPGIVATLASLPATSFVLDGEIVAFDVNGRTDFSLLQQSQTDNSAVFVAFDVMNLMGHDTTGLSLVEREDLVAKTVPRGSNLAVVEHVEGNPEELLARACQEGWEGLVAKRRDGVYRTGRSPDWRKLKCMASQELVIGGWTAPKGARTGFGALLVGYYDAVGRFHYAGKVGTGFSAKVIASIHPQLLERQQSSSPFLDDEGERGAFWTSPELVANIAFTEWTGDGRLRHPSFQGLRTDKAATDVIREQSQAIPKAKRGRAGS